MEVSLCVGLADWEDAAALSTRSIHTEANEGFGFDVRLFSGQNMGTKAITVPEDPLATALDGQIVRDDAEKIKHAYNNVTYFMMGQLNINRENSLRLFVSSYTDSPSITDLQSVYDVSDAQNISHGNPNLKPTYSHRVNFHYTNSNVEKGRTFMWMFSMNTTLDYTASHLVQRPGEITIDGEAYSPNFYSTTTNLDGYWQLRTPISREAYKTTTALLVSSEYVGHDTL